MTDLPLDRIVGSLSGHPLYSVTIAVATLQRARELAAAGAAPDYYDFGHATIPGGAMVATVDVQWFVELDIAVRASTGSRR